MQRQAAIGKSPHTTSILIFHSTSAKPMIFCTIPIADLLLVLNASEHTQNFIFAKFLPLGVQLLATQRDIFVPL